MGLGIAKYECCVCRHRWQSAPDNGTRCECGSMYVRWTNYAEWYREPTRTERFRKVYPL